MKQPEKRLVFHFYVKEGWKTFITNRIHLECLKYYSYIFNEVIFVISVDDITDNELIRDIELNILDLNFTPNISFKIVENNYLRDSQTFYDYIATKLDTYDGLTFFAHNKGTTNLNSYELENVINWITSMYFLSLEYVDEAVYSLTDGRELSYGSLLNEIKPYDIEVTEEGIAPRKKFAEKNNVFLGEHKYLYMGTFFWVNGLSIYEYMRKNDIDLPKLTDRWYAENFCANLFNLDFAFSHKGRFSKNYLQEGAEIIEMVLHATVEEEYNQFLEFKNKIISSIQ